MSLVQHRIEGAIGTLIFDHDAKRNILSEALTEDMFHALEEFRAKHLRVVILRALPGAKRPCIRSSRRCKTST